MQVQVLDVSGNPSGFEDVSDDVFCLNPRQDIIYRVVHWQQSKQRQGSHKVKDRGDVRGTTKKMYKQKGTGSARHGSKRGAQFRGGGIIFGPVVRSHAYSLPKKIRSLGLKMILSQKMLSGQLLVLKSFELSTEKTKDFLKTFSFLDKDKTLFIDGDSVSDNMKFALSNIPSMHLLPQIGANVYDILSHTKLVLSLDGLKALEARLSK
jgi:large subunit ribosomal protein L4